MFTKARTDETDSGGNDEYSSESSSSNNEEEEEEDRGDEDDDDEEDDDDDEDDDDVDYSDAMDESEREVREAQLDSEEFAQGRVTDRGGAGVVTNVGEDLELEYYDSYVDPEGAGAQQQQVPMIFW